MIKFKREGVILRPTRLPFENLSVFNPAIYQDDESVHILYRALSDKLVSTLGYARLEGPKNVVERLDHPILSPRRPYEKHGLEDGRLVNIKGHFYLTYIAHDGKHAVIALACGKNLSKLRRQGIISTTLTYKTASQLFTEAKLKDSYYTFASFYEKYAGSDVMVWEKDGVLFPGKFRGQFAFLHRILPDIQIAFAKSLAEFKSNDYWREHIKTLDRHVVLEPRFGFENRHVGAAGAPIRTDRGWLLIYHAVEQMNRGRIYRAGAALLDLQNPRKVLARLPYPILEPRESYEKRGHVANVVFPSGHARFGERLYLYYGAADSVVAAASIKEKDLLQELWRHREEK